MFVQQQLRIIHDVFSTRCANQDGARIPIQNSPLDLNEWRRALNGYWNADQIINSIEFGWDIGAVGLPNPRSARHNQGVFLIGPPHSH